MYKENIRAGLISKIKGKALQMHNVSFAIKSISGAAHYYPDIICYAQLKYRYTPLSELSIYIHQEKENRKWHLDYVRWMLNHSPWAYCFETKNAKEALNKGVYLRVEKPGVRVFGAIIAMRQFNEFPGFALSYIKLRENGYSPTVSYITAQFIYTRTEYEPFHFGRNFLISGHTVLTVNSDIELFIRSVVLQRLVKLDIDHLSFSVGLTGAVHSEFISNNFNNECSRWPHFFHFEEKDLLRLAEIVKKKIKEYKK